MAEEVSLVEYRGTPIAELGRLPANGSLSTDYEELVSWTVPTGKEGVLFEVSFVTSIPDKTQFKFTIGDDEQFADKKIQAALTLVWKDNKLAAGTIVKVEAKSTEEGAAMIVDGSITGKTLEYE